MNPFNQFETSSIYEMTFIGDRDLRVPYICIKRTAKNVTFQKFQGSEIITKRIKLDSAGKEYVLYGAYSMAPSIRAKNCIG